MEKQASVRLRWPKDRAFEVKQQLMLCALMHTPTLDLGLLVVLCHRIASRRADGMTESLTIHEHRAKTSHRPSRRLGRWRNTLPTHPHLTSLPTTAATEKKNAM
jgi:hypothetical protein